MARRTRKWRPIGQWLKTGRKNAGLTLSELASRTRVSTSALARFESDRAVPSFDDVCVIAQQLGWPLLYFATGRERTGDDTRALAAQLRFWGLRDVRLAEPVLFGEAIAFEELFAEVIVRTLAPRVVEALPSLLLKNKFEADELIIKANANGSLRRLGWLSDVADNISEKLPLEYIRTGSGRRLQAVVAAARAEHTPDEIDYVAAPTSELLRQRVWESSPPVARRWRIGCDITLAQYLNRARSILAGAEAP